VVGVHRAVDAAHVVLNSAAELTGARRHHLVVYQMVILVVVAFHGVLNGLRTHSSDGRHDIVDGVRKVFALVSMIRLAVLSWLRAVRFTSSVAFGNRGQTLAVVAIFSTSSQVLDVVVLSAL